MKKDIVYTLPTRTEKEIQHAERRQKEAYKHYNSVIVAPHGIDWIKIVCKL